MRTGRYCGNCDRPVVDAVAGVVLEVPVWVTDKCLAWITPPDQPAANIELGRPRVAGHIADQGELVDRDALVRQRHLQGGGLAAQPVVLVVQRDRENPL